MREKIYREYGSSYSEATIADHLIAFLFSARSTYIYKRILWERVKERRNASYRNLYLNTYRLRKKGMIAVHGEKLELTEKGRTVFVQNKLHKLIYTHYDKKKKILVLFDIPEKKRKTRDWLRLQLKVWDFKIIQKSVWIGHGPLPKEFHERLDELGIKNNVKVFTALSGFKNYK